MLLVDEGGTITEVNAAGRELFGVDVAGCRGQHYTYLVERLRPSIEGDLLPPHGIARVHLKLSSHEQRNEGLVTLETADLSMAVVECRYHSNRFGWLRLRVGELPCIDAVSGRCAGSIISLEPCDPPDASGLQRALDQRLSHEAMWEVYAASYDRILSEMPFYREVLERHCTAMAPRHIRTILDLGAGTGIPTLRLLDAGKRVTAVDINRAMLRKLRSKLDPACAERLTVIEDTAESLPHLANASFDGVSVLLAFFDMADPLSALREAQRLLKPGGMLIVTEPRSCFDVDQLMAAAEESLRAKGLLESLAGDWQRIQTVAPLIRDAVLHSQTRAPASPLSQVWHAEAIMEILGHDGFFNLTFRESHLGNCATIQGEKPDFHPSRGD
jgi:ubiquinone/menaquinone biosynthesis C-methylase UbiE